MRHALVSASTQRTVSYRSGVMPVTYRGVGDTESQICKSRARGVQDDDVPSTLR